MTVSKSDETPMLVLIKKYVDIGLRNAMDEEFERHKNDLVATLDRRKDEIISGIILNVKKMVDIESRSDRIVFTIRKDIDDGITS